MKYSSIFIFFVLAISCSNHKIEVAENHSYVPKRIYLKEIIKGSVKTCTYNSFYPSYDQNGNLIKGDTLNSVQRGLTAIPYRVHFDKNGLIIKEESKGNKGKHKYLELRRWEYKNGRLHKVHTKLLRDTIAFRKYEKYTYNEKGLIENLTEYEYKGGGLFKYLDTIVINSIMKFSYDQFDNILLKEKKVYEYPPRYLSKKIKPDDTIYVRCEYTLKYDNENNLIFDKHVCLDGIGKEYQSFLGDNRYSRTYFRTGELKRIDYFGFEGWYDEYNREGYAVHSFINDRYSWFEYSDYDEKGNWQKIVMYEGRGKNKPYLIGVRNLEYY